MHNSTTLTESGDERFTIILIEVASERTNSGDTNFVADRDRGKYKIKARLEVVLKPVMRPAETVQLCAMFLFNL